jgi:hypothetical protein
LHSSPDTIRIITLRRMRLEGHVTRTGEKRGAYGVLIGKPEERRPQEDLDVETGSCEHGSGPSGFVRCWKFC